MGVISAIGNTVAENRAALAAGTCGISPMELIESRFAGKLPCGEIKTTTAALAEKLDTHEPALTRTKLLALHAFREAVQSAGLPGDVLSDPGTALINGTTVGGMCLTDELYRDAQAADQGSEYLSAYDCSSIAMFLQKNMG
jgi:3-oxoacyl-(acyl-carrier-protein) synthase